MKLIPRAVIALVVAPALSLIAASAAAQGAGSVVESQGFTPGQAPVTSGSGAGSSNNDALQLLLDQNQQLQAELQALRGMVEEQGFEIRKLQRDSLSRYTDVDDRLRSLETGSITAVSSAPTSSLNEPAALSPSIPESQSPASLTPTLPASGTSSRADIATLNSSTASSAPAVARSTGSGRGTLQPAVLSEQQLYQMAYDSVINSNFERSIAEFDQYLSIYPEGRFVSNAYYWKGQAYLFLRQYSQAVESYETILNEYQDSAKIADSMYGLAQAYEGLGNVPQARRLLNDIKRRFPNTGAANLADTRLLTLD